MRTAVRTPLLALAIVGGLAGTALATPRVAFDVSLLSRATLQERVHINTGEVKLQTKGPVDITHLTVHIGPDGTSGWHEHSGLVLVTMRSGSVHRYHDDCSFDVYSAGQAFTESGPHAGEVRNASSTQPAVLDVTIIGAVGAPLQDDAPAPRCTSPSASRPSDGKGNANGNGNGNGNGKGNAHGHGHDSSGGRGHGRPG